MLVVPAFAFTQARVPGRRERRQVRHRPAADEQAASRAWKAANLPQPVDDHHFHLRWAGASEPRSDKGVEARRQRIRHGAGKIAWTRHEGEEARVVNMKHVRKDVAFDLPQDRLGIGRLLGQRLPQPRLQLAACALPGDRNLRKPGEVLDDEIDDAVAERPHLARAQLETPAHRPVLVHQKRSASLDFHA